MLNKIIQEQLSKVTLDLTNHNEDCTEYIIKQVKQIKLHVDKSYLIKLDDCLTHNADDTILTINWNKGIIPKSEYMIIEVNKLMGNMVLLTGVGYDYDNKVATNLLFSGWLPVDKLTVLESY